MGFQHKAVKCIVSKNIKDNTFQKTAWVGLKVMTTPCSLDRVLKSTTKHKPMHTHYPMPDWGIYTSTKLAKFQIRYMGVNPR